jgi:ATP-dependent helicase/nuclease subunit B
LLLEMAGQRLYSTASELASGSIAIHPAWIQGNASCRYCPYGGICQFDRQLPENGYAVMNAMATQELIQKIREEGGYQDGVDTRTTSGN